MIHISPMWNMCFKDYHQIEMGGVEKGVEKNK